MTLIRIINIFFFTKPNKAFQSKSGEEMDRLGWGRGLTEDSAEMQAPGCGERCCALS